MIVKAQSSKKRTFKEEGMMDMSNAAEDEMGRQWRITDGLDKMSVHLLISIWCSVSVLYFGYSNRYIVVSRCCPNLGFLDGI